jgi:hypothetical protein
MIESESPDTADNDSKAPPVMFCLKVLIDVRTGIYAYPNAPEAFA